MTSPQEPKVFHLITRLLNGGAEAKTVATVLGLDSYEFTVGHGASYDREQADRLDAAGVETVQFPLLRHYDALTALPAVASITRFLRRRDFDVVHTHSTEAGIIGRFAAAAAGVPCVVHTVHGVPFTDDRKTILNRFVLACERQAAKYTDCMVTNADAITEEYLDRGIGSREQYTTIYSGVDLDSFQDAEPATDLPGGRPRIVMVGRLVDGKGFDLLLDAADYLIDDEASICLVGDGPLYDTLREKIVERALTDSVFLTGFRNDVPNVLAASDILVLPSFREGTPRVITEAMASGLPVVASDIAGIPEQVGDGETGFLIPPGDEEALASMLGRLVASGELRRRLGSTGRERVSKFSRAKMLKDIDQLYSAMITT